MSSWTKEPPKEPGWYWCKKWGPYQEWYMRAVRLYNRYGNLSPGRLWIMGTAIEIAEPRHDYLWWPIPITPPSEEKP